MSTQYVALHFGLKSRVSHSHPSASKAREREAFSPENSSSIRGIYFADDGVPGSLDAGSGTSVNPTPPLYRGLFHMILQRDLLMHAIATAERAAAIAAVAGSAMPFAH